ncbi:unnamed protein product [Echinostoma caproni]|uniref:DUF2384 domain-containing protein n=1 Tax=Echinostoma caproni TaxID=27848 RepID=A0A183AY52_9TREM|nr:unnamed protein product [Echinostoma caproni]
MGMHLIKKAWIFVHPRLLINAFVNTGLKPTLNQPMMQTPEDKCDLIVDFTHYVSIDERLFEEEIPCLMCDDGELGGLRYSELIQKHLITAMIPFLPLQEEHVKKCILDVTRQRAIPYTDDLVQFVLQELEWAPEGARMFSVSGCKRVYEKVGLYSEMR